MTKPSIVEALEKAGFKLTYVYNSGGTMEDGTPKSTQHTMFCELRAMSINISITNQLNDRSLDELRQRAKHYE